MHKIQLKNSMHEMMKWRIAKRKLLFLKKVMAKEDSNLCKRSLMNETILDTEGLGHECKVIAKTIGLPDLRDKFATTSKGDIGRAIKKHSERMTKEEVEASRKVGDRASDNPRDHEYLHDTT